MTTIIDVMNDSEIGLGRWFAGESWAAWRVVLKAAFALPMAAEELVVFGELAGGRAPPRKRVRELFAVGGRRSGKDTIASLLAVYAAAIEEGHVGRLRSGEQAMVMCLAVDRDQSRIVLDYIRSYFAEIPDLARLVTRETRLGLELASGVALTVATNGFRQPRGRTISLAILDEVAFWKDEKSAAPDFEVYRAIVPGLATLPSAMLVGISSPYRKAGLLYEKWKQHFGRDSDDVLVIQASSRQLNPTLDASLIERALEDDPAAARSEWQGQWRDDLASYVDIELIENAVDFGVKVRPPREGVSYCGFVDAASGVGQDSFAVGIAHKEESGAVVLDLAHEIRPPFNPQAAIAETSVLMKSYGVEACTGDKYAAGFVLEGFAQHGIAYSYSERDRSAIYVEALPLFTSGRARLVDNRKLVLQFASLERRTSSVGRDRVDHGQAGHDDLCNAAAGVLVLANTTEDIVAQFIRAWGPGPAEEYVPPMFRRRIVS